MTDQKPTVPSTVYTVTPHASVREAAALMWTYGVGDVVVVEDYRPVGILTDRDVVLRVTAQGADPNDVPVQAVMTTPAIVMAEDEELSKAIALMQSHGIRRLPIVGKDGRLRSILSVDDLLFLGISQSQFREIIRTQLRKPSRAPDATEWADGGRRLGEGQGPALGSIHRVAHAVVAPPLGRARKDRHDRFNRILRRNRWVWVVGILSIAAALMALVVAYVLTPPLTAPTYPGLP
jgi:CBS domain-containing protein